MSDGSSNGGTGTEGIVKSVLALPVWLIAIAFVALMCIVAYSLVIAKQSVSLGFLGEWGPRTGALPEGAVVAFDGPCPDKDKGAWEPYVEGNGRVILGTGAFLTGAYGNVNQFRVDLKPGNVGGTDFQYRMSFNGDPKNSESLLMNVTIPLNAIVAADGEAGNHTLKYYALPPFVALTFCRKK